MKYTDARRLERIVSTTRKLLDYIRDQQVTRDDILNQEPLRWTITTPLYNVGEHVYNLSDAFKTAHPEIPWSKISGLRHRLVHDYDNTNWSLICTIIFDVLPEFLLAAQSLLKEEP